MAYYSVAHLFQGGLLTGTKPHSGSVGSESFIPPGPLRIRPDDLTDATFDYIFDRTDTVPKDTPLSKNSLDELRNEFQFW